ncbi:MAG: YndJ family transporter, partial [Micromonosporaceae bacterium]
MTTLVNLAVLLGMFVIVPAGLRLIDPTSATLTGVARWWPVAALPAGISLWLDRGPLAAGLAAAYAAATVVLAGYGTARWARRRRWIDAEEIAVLTALAAPAVAGVALVA